MDLKNITPFDRFRKIYEAGPLPDEFTNKTGFAESLVGRGLFSIIRYFKQGIDMGRLEYLKRKLENEYFAGWLRFCAINEIDLKNGTAPKLPEEPTGDDGGDDNVGPVDDKYKDLNQNVICPLLNHDYLKKNELIQLRSRFEKYINELKQIAESEEDPNTKQEIENVLNETNQYLNLCDVKIKINNESFEVLNQLCPQEGMTFDDAKQTQILGIIEQIKLFLNGEAKACSTYHLTEEEKKVINKLATSTNQPIKDKCNEINSLLGGVPVLENYRVYDLVKEELSTNNVPILNILGDSLNVLPSGETSKEIKVYDYLKSIGIENVNEINFKACDELWRKHPEWRDKVAALVSLEGVRKVQYAASRIIYRVKKTPTYTGITPEKGGGINKEEDSALRTAWERKVEQAKGEWIYFISLEKYDLDPFKAMNLQDAIRKRDAAGDGFVNTMNNAASPLADSGKAEEVGLVAYNGLYKFEHKLVVLQVQYNVDKLAYLLCAIHSEGDGSDTGPHVYIYLGDIDIHKIIDEKIYEKDRFKEDLAKQYATSIKSPEFNTKGCTDLHRYLGLNNTGPTNFQIYGYFFGSPIFRRFNTVGVPRTQKTHFLQMFLNNNKFRTVQPFGEINAVAAIEQSDINLFSLLGGTKKPLDLNNLIKDTETLDWKVGQLFQFKDESWSRAYFPDWDDMRTYENKAKFINDPIFSRKIKLIA